MASGIWYHSDSERGNPLPPHRLLFPISNKGSFIWGHPIDRIIHNTAFVTPVVEHWLEREIAQWVHPMKDRSDNPSHPEHTLLPRISSFNVLNIDEAGTVSYKDRYYVIKPPTKFILYETIKPSSVFPFLFFFFFFFLLFLFFVLFLCFLGKGVSDGGSFLFLYLPTLKNNNTQYRFEQYVHMHIH